MPGTFTQRAYNNQFKGSGRNIYLSFIVFSLATFIFAPFCWFFIWRMLRRKLVVTTDGITIHYAFHKKRLGWNELAGFGYDERDFMNAPIAYGVDGKKYRISMAFKLCPQKIGWRTNYIVDSADVLNQATFSELQTALAINRNDTVSVPQTTVALLQNVAVPVSSLSTPVAQPDASQPISAANLQHVMRGGKISQSNLAEIVYEWQTSKIVKLGGSILYLFWTGVIAGVYHVAGLVAWAILTIAIFIDYKWYKRTKSNLAWYILQSLVGIIVLVLIGFAIAGHYYVP